MDAWRYGVQGVSIALRVTPRGGQDRIDLRAPRVHWRRISVVRQFPAGGTHTLEVRNVDGSRLDMDAFVVYR